MAVLLEYQSQYQVVVCLEHHYALQNIHTHLRDFHSLSKARRKELTNTYSSLDRVEPKSVSNPPPHKPPIPALGAPIDAFACLHEGCNFVCASEEWIRQHAYKHGWRVSENRPTYWRAVKAQTFFRNAQVARYFIVRAEQEEEERVPLTMPLQRHQSRSQPRSQVSSSSYPSLGPVMTETQRQDLAELEQEFGQIRQRHEEQMQVQEKEIAKQDRTGWWAVTRWPEHFSECHYQHLAHASRVPDRDERVLQEAVRVCNLTLTRAVQGLGTLHRELRCWLRSVKQYETAGRPLARLENPDSQDRYFNYWRRFICYSLRVWLSRRDIAARGGEEAVAAEHQLESRQARRRSSRVVVDSDDEVNDRGNSHSTATEENDGVEDALDSDDNDDNNNEYDSNRSEEGSVHDETHRGVNRPTDLMKDARRLFSWTVEQLEAVEKLYDALEAEHSTDDDDHNKQLVACMLRFCRTFICFQFAGSEFESGLVHFAAVLGIDEDSNKLRRASDYSYMVAGMVYCVRILGAEILLPAAEREEQKSVEVREQFLDARRCYLSNGSGTSTSILLTWLAYGKYIAMNTGNAGAVAWSKDKKVLIYRGVRIELTLFCRMARNAVAQASDTLWEELMWIKDRADRFDVPLDDIEDDVVFTRRGYSFLSRESNQLNDQGQWMRRRMIQVLEGARRLYVSGRWRSGPVRRWLRRCDYFLELLLFCVHTTWGQPARGTEVTALRFRNGSLQDRNIFIIDGMAVLVTRYHKSQSQYDRPKVIPRFLPKDVAQLLTVYLVYVQPFREHLRVQVLGSDISDFVWHDDKGAWETPRLKKVIQRQTTLGLGHRFGVLDYRHIAASIGRVIVGEAWVAGYKDDVGEVEEPQVDEESGVELQSGRGELQGTLKYGVPVDIINHLSVRSLEVFRPLSERWHLFLGLLSSSESAEIDLEAHEDGRYRKLTRTSTVSSVKRLAGEIPDEADQRGRSRSRHSAGPAWRRLFPSRNSVPPALAGEEMSSSPSRITDQSNNQYTPRLGYRSSDSDRHYLPIFSFEAVVKALRTVLRDEQAEFRSREQKDAMFAILRGESPLVVVLPTGGGKTLLAMLPTQLDSEGVTVFVAPFRALVNDMVLRFQREGIDTMEWRPGQANPARLVVVSADIAANFGFLSYCQLLQRKRLLRGIFFDEIHLAVTANDWRPRLDQLQELRTVPCVQVFLTVTLPPSKAVTLEINLGLHSPRYIRASTTRTRHRYLVRRCQPNDLISETKQLAQRQQQHLTLLERGSKGIIYCRSRKLCEQLAEELDCLYYHAADMERGDRLVRWVEQGGLIVATSALGTGVDFRSIIWTLHVDLPWSLIDFAQESGRAGRGGEIVDAVILSPEHTAEQMMHEGGLGGEQSAMAHFVGTRDCRRLIMSTYLDGPELAQSCEDVVDAARCDRCGEGITAISEKKRRAARQWNIVSGYLDCMTTGCTLCFMQNSEDPEAWQTHHLRHCQPRFPGQGDTEIDHFRRQIRYDPSSHTCHRCGISQRFCNTGEDATAACQWPQVVVPAMVTAFTRDEGRQALREVGCSDSLQDARGFAQWLSRRYERQIWQTWMSNAMVLLIRLILNDDERQKIATGGDIEKALYDQLEDD